MTYQKTQRILCLLLCLALLLPLLTGCAKLLGGKGTKEVLNAETTRAGSDTLSLDMGAFALDGEAECEIKPVKAPELPGVEMQAYAFTIDTDEELLSVMELTIPYDEKALGGLAPEGNVGAAYFNEETQAWEPVSFDLNDNGTVTIHTEHLSTYGCFVVKDENTRSAYAAYAVPSFAICNSYKVDADSIVTEAAQNGGDPGPLALAAGLEILDNTLSIGSAGVDAISHGLNSASGPLGILEGNSLFDNISDKLGKLGTAVSIAQVAYGMYNVYNGNTDAIFPCYRDALKGSVAYAGGKMGTKLFSLAFLGVLAIDYSINKFGEAAWQGREDIYRKAYSLYYEEPAVKRSVKDWAKLFLNARETAASTERYYLRIEGLIQRYADEFWKDEATVAIYQSEAASKGFTGGGGLNEAMKAEISADFVRELSRGAVQDAFKLIAERDARIAERDVLKELNALKAELNKTCTVELYDSMVGEDKKQSDIAGGKVFVTLPESITDADDWSATLSNTGEGEICFTLLAYLMAGMPGEIKVYDKGSSMEEEPAAVIPFSMDNYTQRVDVGTEALPLEEILGDYDGKLSLSSLVVSDAGYQAYLATLDEDDEVISKAECDEALSAALQESPLTLQALSITSDAPESGQCIIQVTVINKDGDTFPATTEARYEDGFLITQGEKDESRIAVTKGADGVIRIAGNNVHLGIREESVIFYYAFVSMDVIKVG